MGADRRRARREALVRSLAAAELDALLVTSRANIRYLTGFAGSAGLVAVTRADVLLGTGFRYAEQARAGAGGGGRGGGGGGGGARRGERDQRVGSVLQGPGHVGAAHVGGVRGARPDGAGCGAAGGGREGVALEADHRHGGAIAGVRACAS